MRNETNKSKYGKVKVEQDGSLYKRWQGMKCRCYSACANNYHRYGGRGITVCDEWRNNYLKFREWALNNGYAVELQLDRINNDGNYSPDNCRWVTRKENAQNKSSHINSCTCN